MWDRQVAALCVRYVLIHVVDILLVCLFVGASVDLELAPLHLLDTLINWAIVSCSPKRFQSLKSPENFHVRIRDNCLNCPEVRGSLLQFIINIIISKLNFLICLNFMEFSVIETFILLMEERFSLVLIPQILQAEMNKNKFVT